MTVKPEQAQPKSNPKSDILFIACGALAKETKEIIDRHGWSVELKALPAVYHMTPLKITTNLDVMLEKLKGQYQRIIVVYGECGATGIDTVLDRHEVVRVSGPHCYEMYAGANEFARLIDDEPGTFFLTDWLLRAYEKAVLRGLGLDKHPELAPLYFGNYHRLVYLSQASTEMLIKKAQTIAASMGWTFEHRYVGYGELETRLVNLMTP